MSIFRNFAFACICALTLSCTDSANDMFREELVIEGWIENGKPPIVLLTKSIEADGLVYRDSLEGIVGTWAKVTVTDSEGSHILMGVSNQNYFPPYIYTSLDMKGKAGQTYRLDVEYGGQSYCAVTSIPDQPFLDTIYCRKVGDSGSEIVAEFTACGDSPYRFRSMLRGTDAIPYGSYLGLIDSPEKGRKVSVPVNRGVKPGISYTRFYDSGDSVLVYFSKISPQAYDFWDSYDNLTGSRNFASLSFFDLPCSIDGALGYWFGYGTSIYRVIVP